MNTQASQGERETSVADSGAPAEGGVSDLAPESGGSAGGSRVLSRPRPTPQPRVELCPYCGRESVNTTRCDACGGKFDALSRQATQNAMGPWWLRDAERPYRPGCAYETIRALVARGTITRDTVLRGPSTRQFWKLARRAPGVAHLLGVCHACQRDVSPEAFMCPACGASFGVETDRQHLGLAPVSLLPGQASAERIAAVSVPTAAVGGGGPNSAAGVMEGAASLAGSLGGLLDEPARSPSASYAPRGLPRGVRVGDPMNESLAAVRAIASAPGEVRHEPGEGHEHRQSHHHRHRGPSPVAAIAFFVLGVVLTVSGVGAALITAQGGLEQALAAMGLGSTGGTRLADAGGAGGEPGTGGGAVSGSAPGTGAEGGGEGGAVGAQPGPESGGGTTRISQGAPDAGSPANTVVTPGPDSASQRGEALAPILALLASGRTSDVREALGLLDRLARDQTFDAADVAAWRRALEARLARASLGDLP